MPGNRPRISNKPVSADVAEERQVLVSRMQEAHPELSESEVYDLIRSSAQKDKEATMSASLHVNAKVQEALAKNNTNERQELDEKELDRLGKWTKGLEATIASFKSRKSEQKEQATKKVSQEMDY